MGRGGVRRRWRARRRVRTGRQRRLCASLQNRRDVGASWRTLRLRLSRGRRGGRRLSRLRLRRGSTLRVQANRSTEKECEENLGAANSPTRTELTHNHSNGPELPFCLPSHIGYTQPPPSFAVATEERLAALSDSRHVPMLSQPERVLEVIRAAAKAVQGAAATA
jgi:hypothetical protein